jgi:histidyl-tRNA synthetase
LELKLRLQARGTRILVREKAKRLRTVINVLSGMAEAFGAEEISLPIIEPLELYHRVGAEALRHLYSFPEPHTGTNLCLRPEGTATCQVIAETVWKARRDMRLFYVTRCWRVERPQLGRYHEFTQFGVEVLNPRRPEQQPEILIELAKRMTTAFTTKFTLVTSLPRKYSYYTGDGFEINCDSLGSQKQVCGGGPYSNGYGFAFGVERLMLL